MKVRRNLPNGKVSNSLEKLDAGFTTVSVMNRNTTVTNFQMNNGETKHFQPVFPSPSKHLKIRSSDKATLENLSDSTSIARGTKLLGKREKIRSDTRVLKRCAFEIAAPVDNTLDERSLNSTRRDLILSHLLESSNRPSSREKLKTRIFAKLKSKMEPAPINLYDSISGSVSKMGGIRPQGNEREIGSQTEMRLGREKDLNEEPQMKKVAQKNGEDIKLMFWGAHEGGCIESMNDIRAVLKMEEFPVIGVGLLKKVEELRVPLLDRMKKRKRETAPEDLQISEGNLGRNILRRRKVSVERQDFERLQFWLRRNMARFSSDSSGSSAALSLEKIVSMRDVLSYACFETSSFLGRECSDKGGLFMEIYRQTISLFDQMAFFVEEYLSTSEGLHMKNIAEMTREREHYSKFLNEEIRRLKRVLLDGEVKEKVHSETIRKLKVKLSKYSSGLRYMRSELKQAEEVKHVVQRENEVITKIMQDTVSDVNGRRASPSERGWLRREALRDSETS